MCDSEGFEVISLNSVNSSNTSPIQQLQQSNSFDIIPSIASSFNRCSFIRIAGNSCTIEINPEELVIKVPLLASKNSQSQYQIQMQDFNQQCNNFIKSLQTKLSDELSELIETQLYSYYHFDSGNDDFQSSLFFLQEKQDWVSEGSWSESIGQQHRGNIAQEGYFSAHQNKQNQISQTPLQIPYADQYNSLSKWKQTIATCKPLSNEIPKQIKLLYATSPNLDEFLAQNEVEDAREYVVKKTKKQEKRIWMQYIKKWLRNERESKEVNIGIQEHERQGDNCQTNSAYHQISPIIKNKADQTSTSFWIQQ